MRRSTVVVARIVIILRDLWICVVIIVVRLFVHCEQFIQNTFNFCLLFYNFGLEERSVRRGFFCSLLSGDHAFLQTHTLRFNLHTIDIVMKQMKIRFQECIQWRSWRNIGFLLSQSSNSCETIFSTFHLVFEFNLLATWREHKSINILRNSAILWMINRWFSLFGIFGWLRRWMIINILIYDSERSHISRFFLNHLRNLLFR